jgi:hypothetical protein
MVVYWIKVEFLFFLRVMLSCDWFEIGSFVVLFGLIWFVWYISWFGSVSFGCAPFSLLCCGWCVLLCLFGESRWYSQSVSVWWAKAHNLSGEWKLTIWISESGEGILTKWLSETLKQSLKIWNLKSKIRIWSLNLKYESEIWIRSLNLVPPFRLI